MLKSYKELTVWTKSIELVKAIYKATSQLPREEMYVLSAQMRRCSISIPSNIAEGYKRRTRGEYLQFLGIANASSSELETQIIIAKSLYSKVDFKNAESLLDEVQRMLTTMLKRLNFRRSTLTPLP